MDHDQGREFTGGGHGNREGDYGPVDPGASQNYYEI